jgi:hypothetical protein
MKYKLSDLIDLAKLQNLMDTFLSTTGTVSAIFDGGPASSLSPTFEFTPPVSSFFPFETAGRAIAEHLIWYGRYL